MQLQPVSWRSLSLLFALLACPAVASAQEVQVPMDTTGRLMEIDRGLAGRLGLFLEDHPDFRVARLYQSDSAYVLELTLRRDGRDVRQRVPMSAADVGAFRSDIAGRIAASAPEAGMDQDGRLLFLAGTTVMGLGFYGWAVPVALGIESGRGFLATYMFTSAASILLPYRYTRHRPVTYGMTNLWWWGATRGITHGIYAAGLLGVDDGDALAASAVVGSVGEGIAGFEWARRTGMSAGTAHTIGNAGDLGQGWTGALMMIVQPSLDEDIVLGSLLAGSAAGLYAGSKFASRRDFTWGDAEIMRTTAQLGAASGIALWDVVTGDDPSDDEARILGASLLLGSGAGILVADRLLDGRDFSFGQSILIDLGTLAGGAIGLGIAALTSPTGGESSELFTTLGAAGATLGFGIAFASMAESAERRDRRQRDGRLDLQLNPLGLARLAAPGALPGLPSPGDAAPVTPLLNLQYTF